jgi:hypothetical protein
MRGDTLKGEPQKALRERAVSFKGGDTLKGAPPKALRERAVSFKAHALACLVCAVGISSLHAQGTDPLRKTDLIRLLTANTQTLPQIVAMVRRSCVSFTPTARDRQDLAALGGDTTLLKAIDQCVRERAVTPAATSARGGSTRPPATPTAARPRPAASQPAPIPVPRLADVPLPLVAVPLASRVSVPAGGTATVSVALKQGTDPVSGIRLVLRGSARLAGSDSDATAVTDDRGLAQFRFPVGSNARTTRLSVAKVGGDSLGDAPEIELAVVATPTAGPPDRPRPTGSPLGTAASAPTVPLGRPMAERTGFVSGANQRGAAGEVAAQPLIYEVRDGAGRPLGGVGVTFSVTNGRILGTVSNLTDSIGRVRVRVQFGERAGVPTVVTGTIGDVTHDATLYPAAGAPTGLVVLSGGNALVGELVLLGGRATELRIYGRDKFGNVAPLAGLRASSGDERIVRVTEVTSDTGGGSITLTAGKGGSTGVVIEGSGLRADFTAQVHP